MFVIYLLVLSDILHAGRRSLAIAAWLLITYLIAAVCGIYLGSLAFSGISLFLDLSLKEAPLVEIAIELLVLFLCLHFGCAIFLRLRRGWLRFWVEIAYDATFSVWAALSLLAGILSIGAGALLAFGSSGH